MKAGDMAWALRRDSEGVPTGVEAVAVRESDVDSGGVLAPWLHEERGPAAEEARAGVSSALSGAEARAAELRFRLGLLRG